MLPKNYLLMDDVRQLLRSSGSVGANYIEAQDPISQKDASLRIKICRKEAKESAYWLDLLEVHSFEPEIEEERNELRREAQELTKIFGTIVQKLKQKAEQL